MDHWFDSISDYESAVHYFEEARSLSPRDAGIITSSALCHLYLGQYQIAIGELHEVIKEYSITNIGSKPKPGQWAS